MPRLRGELKLRLPPSQTANTSSELLSIKQPEQDRHPTAMSSNSLMSNSPAGEASMHLNLPSPGLQLACLHTQNQSGSAASQDQSFPRCHLTPVSYIASSFPQQ